MRSVIQSAARLKFVRQVYVRQGAGGKFRALYPPPVPLPFPQTGDRIDRVKLNFQAKVSREWWQKKEREKRGRNEKKKKKGRKKKIEESFTWATKIRAYCESETELLTRHTFFPPVDVFPTGSAK